MIDIRGLDRADVLAALYNAAQPQGMGFMHYDPKPMGRGEARKILSQIEAGGHRPRFDYLKGRVMKVNLGGDEFDEGLYDRDNGDGAAAQAVNALRASGLVNPVMTRDDHERRKNEQATILRDKLHEPTVMESGVMRLGLSDVAKPLGAAIDKATKP